MEIINLDMTPSTVTPNAHAGQYDASRTTRFMLKNGGVPFTLAGTETITAEITRSDNTEVTVNVANTSSNYVDVVFDDTVCTVKGLYACELRLKDSDGFDIGSKNFALLVQRDPYDGAGIHVVTVGPADICTFETTLAEPLQSVIVDIEATGGNGTPDNPNPINGYTEAKITRCGVNFLDKTSGLLQDKFIDTYQMKVRNIGATGASIYCRIKGGQTYTVSKTLSARFVIGTTTDEPALNTEVNAYKQNNNATSLSITTTENDNYLVIFFFLDSADTLTQQEILDTIQVEVGSQASAYHPYTGNTYTIAFGQTVFGGVLDVTRGKLHVTQGVYTFTGNESITPITNELFRITISDYASDISRSITATDLPDSKMEVLRLIVKNQVISNENVYGLSNEGQDSMYLFIRIGATTTTEEVVTAITGKKMTYPLATPFDIDLTPEVISAIVGENNVFADCGETTVKYLKAGG